MRPPFWWSELKALGACRDALHQHRHAPDFETAVREATRHQLDWLFNRLGLRAFMPRQNNATESDLDFHRRLTEFSLWHRNVLLWHLKDSWRQRTKITRLTNALSKALRRK